MNEDFTNLATGDLVLPAWQISSTSTTGTVDTDGGGNKALKIVSSVLYGGFVRYFSTINGTSYTVKVKIKNTHQTNISIRRRDPNNYANYQQVTGQLKSASAGYVELTFTFTAQSGWEYYLHVQNQTATGTTVTYYADDIQVYYTGTVTQTLCTDDNSYRYGFNNQEKDNELYGTEGTAYAFEYRIHDTRLGRFLSVDPLAPEYPWNSSYGFAENKVIWGKDLEGAETSLISDWIGDQIIGAIMASDIDDYWKNSAVFIISGLQETTRSGDFVRNAYGLLNMQYQGLESGLPVLWEAMQRGITRDDLKKLGLSIPAGQMIQGKIEQISTILNEEKPTQERLQEGGKLAGEIFVIFLSAKFSAKNGITKNPQPSAKTPVTQRLPQDIALGTKKVAPPRLPTKGRTIGKNANQNIAVQQKVTELQKKGATDIRIDQQQVDVNGHHVGVNRPDLQYTLDGKRYYIEWDTPSSNRGAGHETRIRANDPNAGGVELIILE